MNHCRRFFSLISLLVLAAFLAVHTGLAATPLDAQAPSAAPSLDGSFAPVLVTAANVRGIVPLSSGKVLIYGDLNSVNGTFRSQVAILNSDGSLDTSFTLDPLLAKYGIINTVVAVSGGKFLIGGSMIVLGATRSQSYLFRVDASGTIDPTFDAGGYIYTPYGPYGLNGPVNALYVDGSGRILVGGDFTSPHNHITRLLPDGAPDASFDPGTGTDGIVYCIAMQSSNHIIIGGVFNTVNGIPSNNIARLGVNGALDGAFFGSGVSGSSIGSDGEVNAVAVQSNDAVLVGGGFVYLNGAIAPQLARVHSDGSLDTTFVPIARDYLDEVTSVLPVGSQVVVGGWNPIIYGPSYPLHHEARLYVLSSTGGEVDYMPFAGDGTDVWALAQRSDGKVLAGGSFVKTTEYTPVNYAGVFLFTPSPFAADPDFSPQIGGQATVRALAVQSDQQILAAGNFYYANGSPHGGLARLSSAGALDQTLSPDTRFWTAVGVRPDGKIAAGQDDAGSLALFEPDGSAGATASPGWIYHLVVQPDNKTLTATNHAPGVTRFHADMSPDADFSTNMGSGISNAFNPDGEFDRVDALALQGSSIIAGGSFSTFSGAVHQNLVRLNANGSLDATFTPPAFTVHSFRSEVFALVVQPDGKILVGGRFITIGGAAKPSLARLNSDGTLDATFQSPLGDGQIVYALALQPDGKILAGGIFGLVRLNADGSRDATFSPNVSGTVKALAFVHPNKLLLGGNFTSVEGQARFSLARYTVPDAVTWKDVFLPLLRK